MKKKIIPLFLLYSTLSWSQAGLGLMSAYFERPLNCPLRFSNLSQLRDQVQLLTSNLGKDCTQTGQQALKQLNASVGNLEGIATAWSTYNGTDQKAQNALLAKNASQVLGNLNIITSNNSCFYDIRSRGALTVISDIVMSLSQVGLLVPNTTGIMAAAGGHMLGSGMKIINELVKRKFNWNRPEERRAFLQLNCAFFDARKVMEEVGLFNPETKSFKDQLIADFKKERLQMMKLQKKHESDIKKIEEEIFTEIDKIPSVKDQGLNPFLKRKLDELNISLASRPTDYASKWRQASQLALLAPSVDELVKGVKVEGNHQEIVRILQTHFENILPELGKDGKVWSSTLDEFEIRFRAPLVAFSLTLADLIHRNLLALEAQASVENKETAQKLSLLRAQLKEARVGAWSSSQRIIALESKISSLEATGEEDLFSQNDEGKSDAVELLDGYRKLQRSILGKEGRGYLKHTLSGIDDYKVSLEKQNHWFDESSEQRERCAAAEKLRFVWAQYRYKTQEAYDFIATNLDLYRSSFKIGKERQRKSTSYVINQMTSIDGENTPLPHTVGDYMKSVRKIMNEIEGKLQRSGCF